LDIWQAGVMLDPGHLLSSYGVVGVGVVLFLETGLLLGLLLPGETLTILAGAFSHVQRHGQPHPQLSLVILMAALGAVLGGQLGYVIGRRTTDALHDRPDGRIYKRRHLERTHAYFERHGAETVLIARFVPFVRTLASPAAGIAEMPIRRFTAYNVAGAVVWAVVVATIGYVLGGILDVDRHALPITLGILVVSAFPGAIEVVRHRRRPERD
jgi:membrane-associated protein